MPRYKVWVRLEAEYDDIIADNDEDAFIQASDAAMEGGSWSWNAEEIAEEEEVNNESN